MSRSPVWTVRDAVALVLGLVGASSGASAANPVQLPVPCATGACGASGPSQWVTAGRATSTASANTLTINQSSNSAVLNWSSFNVSANGSVTFKQPSSSAIALNRIYQASPSQIFGQLSANGQVYLINLNGFIFGTSAVVNVGGLLASSLPMSDAAINGGILAPLQQTQSAALDAKLDPLSPGGRTYVLDQNGAQVLDSTGKPILVQVVVQQGAQITAADQGRVLLAGQNVTNAGTLSAPDGQVILAAGTQVYLQADSDPSVRGLIVEVDANKSNVAWNQLTGTLSAPRGNVTMVGLAVNQDGRVSATTSVAANGSIRLEAAQGAQFGGGLANVSVASTQGGTLTLGASSEMDILPETASNATAVADQTQYPSSVTLLGEQVILKGGSITAPNANLNVYAAANPSSAATNGIAGGDDNARIRIDPGTTINLAGSQTTLPVTANLVSGQLRSTELADDPTQRDGALHGLTVYIDSRNAPASAFANLSGEVSSVPQTIAQRTETGGNAVFQSEGDVVFAGGASLNVSGGSTTYTGAQLQTTYLVGANGQLYPIATANPLLTYVGVVNPTFTNTYNTWGVQDEVPTPGLSSYQPGYVQGMPAGKVQFAAPTLVLQGTLTGNAVNGVYQRTPATMVAGGQLTIGIPGGAGFTAANPPIDFLSPGVRVTSTSTPIVVADDAAITGPLTLEFPAAYLTSSGFTSTQIYSNYEFTLQANTPLLLPAGSALSVSAARVTIDSSITDPGGKLNFQNVLTLGTSGASAIAERAGVFVADDVALDVGGQWTNDALNPGVLPLAQVWVNGGSIALGTSTNGALLSFGNNDTLHASGGGWLNAAGTLVPGAGGAIALNGGAPGGFNIGSNLAIDAFGMNGAAGGSFSLTAPRIEIGDRSSSWTIAQNVDDSVVPGAAFVVNSSLFSNFGFQNVSLTANGTVVSSAATTNSLTVDPGTQINALVSSYVPNPTYTLTASGATLAGVATVQTPAAYLRPAASVSLAALAPVDGSGGTPGSTDLGDLYIAPGASIITDAGGKIALSGLDSILVDGTLRAPGGAVSLQIFNVGITNSVYGGFEQGFLSSQRIELGSAGVIDVSGTLVAQAITPGVSAGSIAPGGSVTMLADRGAVYTDVGSLISVAGITAGFDTLQPNGSYDHVLASSAGGSIEARSGETISLLGNISAAGGSGGTSGAAAAGSLDVELTRSQSWWQVGTGFASSFNSAPLTVEILPTVPSSVARPSASSNQAVLGAQQLTQSGIDSLRLLSGDEILLSGTYAMNLGRQLVFDAPVVSAAAQTNAALTAPYVQVGNSQNVPNTNVASAGTGSVVFGGSEIDLLGVTVFQGLSNVTFSSSGDLVLRGIALGSGADTLQGSVSGVGNLTFDAARLYPVTVTNFSIAALEDANTGLPGIVTFGQTNPTPGTPLSAGANLTVSAFSVTNSGSLYAPFGSITLNGTNGITLADGSLTSVSGAGLTIPYGRTQFGGTQWVYDTFAGNYMQTVGGVPTRSVSLSAPSVSIAKSATIDLTGGGDLLATEWVPGAGGTNNALAPYQAATSTAPAVGIQGLYAVLPSTRGQASPQDPLLTTNAALSTGETVYLSGAAGLAAGFYPLLPASYALVPGAYLVRIEPQFQSATGGTLGQLSDGTTVVGGFLSYGSTGLHQTPGYTGFAVYPGNYGNRLADYTSTLASQFFSAAASAQGAARPTLPADAGNLSISVSQGLDVSGQVETAAATGGLGASIQLSAADLVVGTASGPVATDAVAISDTVISSWHPGSLLLGGTVASLTPTVTSSTGVITPGSTIIDVTANTVTIGAGASLAADQITVVANEAIEVQSGATLKSTSAGTTGTATLPSQQSVTLQGPAGSNPALLAVSDLNWLIPSRAAATTATDAGTIAVDAGANLASRSSLTLDGLGAVTLNGNLSGVGAEWSLGSSSIGIGAAGGQSAAADALSIAPSLVTQLGEAGAVRLVSTGAIDFFAPLNLGVGTDGSPTLNSLTLGASALNNLTGASSSLGAKLVTLEGAGATASPATAGTNGSSFSVVAGELDLGPNALSVNGFASTHAVVSGAVVGRSSGAVTAGELTIGGDLAISASGITVAPTAQTGITATGEFSFESGGSGVVPVLLGGALSLGGADITIGGLVTAPAGIVTLNAVHDLTLQAGGAITAAGTAVTIVSQSGAAPGGTVTLNAGGNLILHQGSSIDVSGSGTSPAGAVTLTAGGTASVGSVLKGVGGTGATAGSFAIDAESLGTVGGSGANPLDQLAANLLAGGFSDSIRIRTRSGDLVLDGGSVLSANAVMLTADGGKLDIGGAIATPSADLRGKLALFGGTGVELLAGGVLRADGAGTSGLGGAIEIGAGELVTDQTGTLNAYNAATIVLDAGSSISTAGAAGMGTLLLRAPALLASNDIAIGTLAANTSDVGAITVEPVLPFNTATSVFSSATAPSSNDFANIAQTVGTYLAVAGPNIAARLGSQSAAPMMIEAGVEIVAAGSLTLPALDLSPSVNGASPGLNWRFYNAAPADLTVRAGGDIEVAGTLSDGFDSTTLRGSTQPTLMFGPSSSIRLVAGADLSSANPLSVISPQGVGNLTIDSGAVVRTGTGDINLVAANDIILADIGSGAYTAGVPTIAAGGTAVAPYQSVPTLLGTALAYGVQVPRSGILMSFPSGGGNLSVSSGRDIVELASTSAGAVTDWQVREGGNSYSPTFGNSMPIPAEWGVNLARYDWNFATLGGGDVVISAGRDANRISAAAADSLLPQNGAALEYVTGGGLTFTAGRDIGSSQVFVADGPGTVTSRGALTATLPSVLSTEPNVGSAFYVGSGSLDVSARLGIAADGFYNPTALGQTATAGTLPNIMSGSFFSYSDSSSVRLETTVGDVEIGNAPSAAATILGAATQEAEGVGRYVAPGSLSIAALGGNIAFGPGIGQITLAPSPTGQLNLLAARDISNAFITLSDAPPGSYAAVATPTATIAVDGFAQGFEGNVHVGDTAPALVTAGGDIDTARLSIPKAAQIVAGRDIVDLNYFGENLSANDQTALMAGRDIVYTNANGAANSNGISLGGPGELDILAGRNITLGLSYGVVTTGNLLNANLASAQGANVRLATGLGTDMDTSGFVSTIVAPSATYQAELVTYVENLLGSTGLSFADAKTAFLSLPVARQQPLLDAVFFSELSASGLAANSVAGAGFAQGYAAIDALFPASRSRGSNYEPSAYAGDLSMQYSQIYTLSGGDISLVVPNGQIDVGLANPPGSLTVKPPSRLGIVAEGAGNIDIYAKGDVDVNSSRIFTLGGGNILIWSDEGSIDAGRGSKSAVSAPPPTVLINSNGTVTLDFSGAAAGSGIRTIQTEPTTPQGDVDLIAPVGTVNAGDAGIGASGNINIAAQSVLGVSNINFGGTATGVPALVSNVSASLAGAANAGAGATNAATSSVAADAAEKETQAPLAQTALSWLDVFVTGLGEENCKPDDVECLKRQKTATH